MNEYYKNVVKLLIDTLPYIFADDTFVLKGGTAINLFYQDLPRLSVDIDLAYANKSHNREIALENISRKLAEISQRLNAKGISTDKSRFEENSTKLIVSRNGYSVKIEVNHVFRGVLNPPQRMELSAKTEDLFMSESEALVMSYDELYAGKLVAALSRQHPRDLFDVKKLYESGGISDGIIENFICYLCGGNGDFYETLNPNPKNINDLYEKDFYGMTFEETSSQELLDVFKKLKSDILSKLTERQREFLVSFAKTEPNFSLTPFPELDQYPAIQWKLLNLKKFKEKSQSQFEKQHKKLAKLLAL